MLDLVFNLLFSPAGFGFLTWPLILFNGDEIQEIFEKLEDLMYSTNYAVQEMAVEEGITLPETIPIIFPGSGLTLDLMQPEVYAVPDGVWGWRIKVLQVEYTLSGLFFWGVLFVAFPDLWRWLIDFKVPGSEEWYYTDFSVFPPETKKGSEFDPVKQYGSKEVLKDTLIITMIVSLLYLLIKVGLGMLAIRVSARIFLKAKDWFNTRKMRRQISEMYDVIVRDGINAGVTSLANWIYNYNKAWEAYQRDPYKMSMPLPSDPSYWKAIGNPVFYLTLKEPDSLSDVYSDSVVIKVNLVGPIPDGVVIKLYRTIDASVFVGNMTIDGTVASLTWDSTVVSNGFHYFHAKAYVGDELHDAIQFFYIVVNS